MIIPRNVQESLISLAEKRKVFLEGNIIKVIEYDGHDDFSTYLSQCLERDKQTRAKRLEVTKQVQKQNKELAAKAKELEKQADEKENLMIELKEAVQLAEDAKNAAENDLDLLQKKTQFELIGNIVQVALWVIVGVGVIVTGMYTLAILHGSEETTLIGSTWSNLFGILLTNSFSIIGTIMGVKYASEKTEKPTK